VSTLDAIFECLVGVDEAPRSAAVHHKGARQ
jgi:hypothetical protein